MSVQTNQPNILRLPDENYTIDAADSGKLMLIDTVTEARTYTLPPPMVGLHYIFINKAPGELGGNVTITGGSDSMQGLLIMDSTTDQVMNAKVNFIDGESYRGDRVEIWCDGEQWSTVGVGYQDGALTATD